MSYYSINNRTKIIIITFRVIDNLLHLVYGGYDMKEKQILKMGELDFLWETDNPFLFCAHHKDAFPKGNDKQEVDAKQLSGRNIGNDFQIKDGFRMYHGDKVPGFPAHPHRGFETVTIVLEGFVDHTDGNGSTGRYGNGDVQWMTAGSGLQHAEMFPLVYKEKENPLDLFQIWLNLPKKSKFTDPYYKMLWVEDIPVIDVVDNSGKKRKERLISGTFAGVKSLAPSPDSWAANPGNHVGVELIQMEPGAIIKLPAVSETLSRNVYYYIGESIGIGETIIEVNHRAKLAGNEEITITNGAKESYMLVLEGEPIQEPVVQYGPFVMNTQKEIQEAFIDFQKTEFGGWPFKRYDPVNSSGDSRFARYPDGRVEERGPFKS